MTNKPKLKFARLLLFTIISFLFFLPTVVGFASGTMIVDNPTKELPETVTQELQANLDDYIKQDTQLRNWKLLDLDFTLTSANLSGTEATAIFDVERKHVLNFATAEDVKH